MTLVLAFCLIAVFFSGRCKANAVVVGNGTAEFVNRDLIVPDNGTVTDEPDEVKEPKATEPAAEPTPTTKPKKQLAAEQYALGVILAGGIAIGMMIALFFYYTKQNNIHKD